MKKRKRREKRGGKEGREQNDSEKVREEVDFDSGA